MIKTYDEALKTLNDIRTYLAISRADDCVEELDKVARYFINEKHKENPTFEQCIKEWERRGWTYSKSKPFNWFIVEKNYKKIIFDGDEINYSCAKEFDIDLELNDLIHKTLKALEVEDE